MVKWTPQLCRTLHILLFCLGLPWASVCNAGDLGSISGCEDPLEKGMGIVQVFLPGEFHGQRSLASYRPWGCKESDTIEQLIRSFSHTDRTHILPTHTYMRAYTNTQAHTGLQGLTVGHPLI